MTTETLTTVTERGVSVVVRRIETPRGERLELDVEGDEATSRLDAIALECLTWQKEEAFLATVREGNGSVPSDGRAVKRDLEASSRSELTRITNEFSRVDVSRVIAGEREFLEVRAPKLGRAIALNAGALRSVGRLDQRAFTELLAEHLNG
ncbi:hypothetical protein [Natrarchaeobius oligotrophus]|uniref:hypothetical protein n=1 Tax=Natrarchaeobius oligotrophus TaxID=3455743 RepID=UPI000F52B0A9|nr:hypothetical protein [Natrarchaeobius chitinivorans]